MRRNTFLLPTSVLFLLLSVQCHKEPRDSPDSIIDLVISNYGGIDTCSVVLYDSPVDYIRLVHNKEIITTGRGGVVTLPLDVDDDGTADFEFRLDSWSQMSGTGWSKASVKGIHGTFEFNTSSSQDTTFQSDSFQPQDGSSWNKKVAVIDTRTISCRRLKDQDSILSIGKISRANYFRDGDLKSPTGEWSREEVFFHNESIHSSLQYDLRQNTDTIWFLRYNWKEINDCHSFPADTVCIWIRYAIDGSFRTGFIRLHAVPGQISVLESEIQK
jgi:hypothetical protein